MLQAFLLIALLIGVGTAWIGSLVGHTEDKKIKQLQNPNQVATPTPFIDQVTIAPENPFMKSIPTQGPSKFPNVTELKIEDIKVGEGQEVKSGDLVSMHYTGTLTDGSKFDSSIDKGTPFQTQIGVGRVIKGWDEGIPGMKVGGKRRLIVPPDKGYGAQGYPGVIPPNATLIFEVELLNVQSSQGE